MSSSEQNNPGYLKSVIQILSGTRSPISLEADQQPTVDLLERKSDLHEETNDEETVYQRMPTNFPDDVEKSQRRQFQTDIPHRFSQPSDTHTRVLSDGLGGTSGLRGVAPRQFFTTSDHMPLSTMNRSVYETEHSVRFKDADPRENVTVRESKRPQERPKDKEYRRRYSSSSREDDPEPRGGHSWPRDGDNGRRMSIVTVEQEGAQFPQFHGRSPALSVPSPLPRAIQGGTETPFSIKVVYEGTSVTHRVWATMQISQLISEIGDIFGLDQHLILLVLISAIPSPISKSMTISGPPRILPDATVMVFVLPDQGCGTFPPRTPGHVVPYVDKSYSPNVIPALNSKLLSSFKLPKFDGAARIWKAWDRAFQRFLGLHQLDHVLEEDFPSKLWGNPGGKEANKLVFFLLEDAVAPGSLASKYVRQAAKWDGHGAYSFLHNGYVFSGPQTATILLGELSGLRLLRDENASAFCLRLVELIEDLEMIPGNAAVFLTETQKLGYLLSAIRHEPSLQSVYVQLQSDQLRGRVSFEEACRELHFRVEAMRADDLMDSRVGKALISTHIKKNGQGSVRADVVMSPCLSKLCNELVASYMPLCKICYLQCMAGKLPSIELRDNLGKASYNPTSKRIDYPASVPASRLPKAGMKKKGRKVLVGRVTDGQDPTTSAEDEISSSTHF